MDDMEIEDPEHGEVGSNESDLDGKRLHKEDSASAALTSRTCDVFHVSFISVSNEPRALSKLERLIEGLLADNISLNERSAKTTYNVKITLLPSVVRNQHDSASIKLEIFVRSYTVDESNDPSMIRKPVCQCLFTSSHSTGKGVRFLDQKRKKSIQNLPVFIWNGTSAFWNIMKPILESSLKCCFIRVNFTKLDLQFFAGIWCIQELKRKVAHTQQKLQITYGFAKDPVELTCIVKLKPWRERLIELGEFLEKQNELKKGLSTLWRDINKEHEKKSGINLERSVFKRIATQNCIAGAEGKIKLKKRSSMDEINHALTYFTRVVERQM